VRPDRHLPADFVVGVAEGIGGGGEEITASSGDVVPAGTGRAWISKLSIACSPVPGPPHETDRLAGLSMVVQAAETEVGAPGAIVGASVVKLSLVAGPVPVALVLVTVTE
jgi:hypothetical protein